jgi:2-methylcitrate dehydratase PrpD
LLNGTAAHTLDFDDVDDMLIGHPSTVLVPAVLAVAEQTGASGALAAEAYWRGLTVMRSLAAGLGVGSHYARGWHSTSTLGVIGAAAAGGVLLRLDVEQAGHALAIAVSRAAGSRHNFGSMTKPLHAGLAAADGVFAAALARGGFTAGYELFDGPYGFLSLYNGGTALSPADRLAASERVLDALQNPGPAALNVKLFACCYATHAAADAALDLVHDGLTAADVADIRVAVPPGGLQPLINASPRTGLEAKFSMAHVVACCVVDGRLGLGAFTDLAVARPTVRDLSARVTAAETLSARSSDGLVFQAEVTVSTRSGQTIVKRCDAPRGHVERPADAAAVLAKFEDCVAFGGVSTPPDLARRLLDLHRLARVADVFALGDGQDEPQ